MTTPTGKPCHCGEDPCIINTVDDGCPIPILLPEFYCIRGNIQSTPTGKAPEVSK